MEKQDKRQDAADKPSLRDRLVPQIDESDAMKSAAAAVGSLCAALLIIILFAAARLITSCCGG